MQEIIINEKTSGGRMDKTVMKYLNKAASGFVYKMIRKKNIELNGKKAKGDEILKTGDCIRLFMSDETIQKFRDSEKKERPSAQSDLLSKMIVYEDENVIAVNKPVNMLSQKSEGNLTSINDLLVSYLGESELFTPGISNRLDRNTSGLILAGKNPNSVRVLNQAIKSRSVQKLYLCIVKGYVASDSELDGYLIKNEKSNKVQILNKNKISGKMDNASAIKTKYKVLSYTQETSLLQVDLITGKPHQIRAHLASIGHPIIGDFKYGDPFINQKFKQRYGLDHQLLHAYIIHFNEMNGILDYLNNKEIIAPLPRAFHLIIKGEKLCLHGNQED